MSNMSAAAGLHAGPPKVPPRPVGLAFNSPSASGSGTPSQAQRKSVPSTAAPSGLYEERIAELGARADEVRQQLLALYTYDPNAYQYEMSVNEISGAPADADFLAGCSPRVVDNRFIEACEKGFRALRFCSIASRRLQALLTYATFCSLSLLS